ncbi:MAG: hypothetical protein IRY87_03695 [Acetobacteraceae bacterium]|nr:hypothetical protein [Acetobacteraceae bacterium]
MTSSGNGERPATTLRAELRKEIPQLFAPGFGLRHDAVAEEAALIERRWGGARIDAKPRPDVFVAIKAALEGGRRGVEALPARLLPFVPYAMLYGTHTGRDDGDVVRAYLGRLHEAGRSAPRRLWPHYLLSLERDDLATNEIASWLKGHRGGLPGRLADFTDKYDALDPARATERMAREVLAGDGLGDDIRAVGVGMERLHTAALLAEILGSVGILLRGGARPADAVRPVRAILPERPRLAIDQTQARERAKRRALGTFIEGIVTWQRRADPHDSKPGPVLDLVLELNEDPRFDAVRWQGVVPKPTIDIVEGWLTQHTIEAFFRVANQVRIERADMWAERRKFWMSYLPYVRRAWLIVGDQGVPFARRERIRFGRFSGGADEGHCGLMLDFGDLRVLEMNMNGRAILWRPGEVRRGEFPEVYDETPFDRRNFSASVARSEVWQNGCIGLGHRPPDGWQQKFADHIQQRTDRGIRPKGM